MRRLSGRGSVRNSITTLPRWQNGREKHVAMMVVAFAQPISVRTRPVVQSLEAKRKFSKMFWDQVTIFDERFLCNICTALGYFSKPGLMRLCMSGAIWAESSVAAAATPSGILSILITLGAAAMEAKREGESSGCVWEREGEKTERIRGDWKRQSGRKRDCEGGKIQGQIGPQGSAISCSWNYLVGLKFEFEDCYSFHPRFFELHQCDKITSMCRFLRLYLLLCAK